MGDAADDAFNRAMDEWIYAEDGENFGGSERPAARPRCKTCGATDVMWLVVDKRWCLCDNKTGEPHQCPAAQLMENLDA